MVKKLFLIINMDDREKVLRWNLQEALKQINEPLDIDGNLFMGMAFGIMKEREQHVDACRRQLDEYLKNKDK